MCGIAGVVSFTGGARPRTGQLHVMCDHMIHRGPDDCGIEVQDGVGLGMRRLSIIDLAGGHQPIFNEDRTVRVVFNGEIYNFRELRSDLERRGHRFATKTDTEVIVHLWEDRGPGFVKQLNGMFAIALHDVRQRKLVLARDHLGIKPLFYGLGAAHLVFGSEVKVVLASGLVERKLDVDALGQFLAWEYAPGNMTLLQGVKKLEPATIMIVDLPDGQLRIERYWDIPLPGDAANSELPRTTEQWEETIDAKLRECVQRQLVSDVPLGAFLSGGVDSSLVVAGMGPARTFSIGFDDATYNELGFAQAVARHLGVSHRHEVIKPDIAGLFDRLMPFMDDPIGDSSIFPTYLVSRLAREEVTVALTGDGGDELFGGYETYVAQQRARAWSRLPEVVRRCVLEPAIRRLRPSPKKKGFVNKAKRFVEGLDQPLALGHSRWRVYVGRAVREQLFTVEAREQLQTEPEHHIITLSHEAGTRDETDRSLYVDVRSYLCDNCLVKVDRMSMACSLEARVPFLEPQFVSLAFAMPSKWKVSRGKTKRLLKRVAARHVPGWCVYRPKQGFSIPIKNWLRAELRPMMLELLDPRKIAQEGVLQADTVQRLKREHLEGLANHSHILWSLMVFQDWRRRWAV